MIPEINTSTSYKIHMMLHDYKAFIMSHANRLIIDIVHINNCIKKYINEHITFYFIKFFSCRTFLNLILGDKFYKNFDHGNTFTMDVETDIYFENLLFKLKDGPKPTISKPFCDHKFKDRLELTKELANMIRKLNFDKKSYSSFFDNLNIFRYAYKRMLLIHDKGPQDFFDDIFRNTEYLFNGTYLLEQQYPHTKFDIKYRDNTQYSTLYNSVMHINEEQYVY